MSTHRRTKGRRAISKPPVPLRIDSLAYGGDGVGRWNGLAVFVPYSMPGDRLRVRIGERKKSYARGTIQSIEEPSGQRIQATCPLFGRCGGCQWQMLPYGVQLEAKRALVEEALARIGKLGPVAVDPVEGMEDPWRYRNKAQLPVQVEGRGVAVGYYAQRSHRVIDLRTCPVHHESLDRALETVRGALGREELPELKHILVRTGFATGETLLVLVTWSRRPLLKLAARIWEKQAELVGIAQNCNPARTNVVLGRETFPLRGKTAFRERLKDRTLQVSATSFFQINPPQAERLYALALELADPQRSDTFVDAYCGVGGMSFYLAERAGAVIGIEEIYSSIQDAIQNARRNGVDRCRFVQSRVEEVLPQLERVDGLVIDPPRSGCSPSVLGEILRISPRRVVYISCDPATLARDLAVLVEGGYRINRVVPIDFFPQTYHIEVVVSLAR